MTVKKVLCSLISIIIGIQMNTNSVYAANTNARVNFGISAGVNFTNNKIKFKINDSLYNSHMSALRELFNLSKLELKKELKPYKKPVDTSKVKKGIGTVHINAYTSAAINSNTNSTQLPNNPTTITLNSSEYDSGANKTKYILVNSGNKKYNTSTGLIDSNGNAISAHPVEVMPNILSRNNVITTDATHSTGDTRDINNYYQLTTANNFQNTNVNEVYVTPGKYEILRTIDNSINATPTHVCTEDLGPVTQSVIKDIVSNRSTFVNWITNFNNKNYDDNIVKYNNKFYINSKSCPNLGLDDNLLKDICVAKNADLLESTRKSFNDVNKWSVGLNIGLFTDVFFSSKNLVRLELSFAIPVHNNRFEIYNENKLYDYKYYGISIKQQASMQLKLMFGHYFTNRFKFLIGFGLEHSRYKLGLYNLYTQYSIDNYAQTNWMKNTDKSVIDGYKNTLTNVYGIVSDYIKKDIIKWSAALIMGFEFNVSRKNILGIEVSVNPGLKLMDSKKNKGDFGDLKLDFLSISFIYKRVF